MRKWAVLRLACMNVLCRRNAPPRCAPLAAPCAARRRSSAARGVVGGRGRRALTRPLRPVTLKPELFEGMRFDFNKGINQKFSLTHSVCMGSVEARNALVRDAPRSHQPIWVAGAVAGPPDHQDPRLQLRVWRNRGRRPRAAHREGVHRRPADGPREVRRDGRHEREATGAAGEGRGVQPGDGGRGHEGGGLAGAAEGWQRPVPGRELHTERERDRVAGGGGVLAGRPAQKRLRLRGAPRGPHGGGHRPGGVHRAGVAHLRAQGE